MPTVMRYPSPRPREPIHLGKRCIVPLVVALLFALVAGLLGGCAQTSSTSAPSSSVAGIEKCATVRDCLAYGYALNTGVRRSATSALNSKAIAVADFDRILASTDLARAALDEGRKLERVDPSTALGKVQYAVGLLSAGEKFLATKGVK